MLLTFPWVLLGLLATAIPVAIHLFELRRPKRVLFTNVGFIQEVKLITARQRKIKHLLVLLARIGFVVFLVLMFAQPYIPARLQEQNKGGAVGVLVDTSPSMQAGSADEEPRFDKAIREARSLPSGYPTATQFVLATGMQKPVMATVYQQQIDKLTISGQSQQFRSVLSGFSASTYKAGEVFVFSDFQRSTFSLRDLGQLDSTKQIFLVPLADKATRNVFVDSVWLDDAFVRTDSDVMLHVRLRNGGNENIENCQVKLFVEEKQAMALSVSVPASAEATATARVRLVGASDAQCRVELEDYPVTFDNIYNFMLRPSSKIQVLDIAAQEAPATQRLYGNEPLFSYRRVSANGLNYPLVDAANVVVVQGHQELSASLRESLRRVVQRGGSVVVVPDADSKGRASYDLLFRELGVGPIQWENANGPAVAREVATPDRRNPFFRDVFGVQSRQPAMPKAAPVLRWSRSGMDLLRLQDGEGFLASFGSGKGTVYLFSTPFDAARTDFPQHALFVPVMYKLAMQSLRQEQPLAYQLTQGSITVPVELGSGQREQVFKLTQDSLTYIPGQRLQAGQLHLELPAAMREPGFYTLTNGGRTVTTLAFNNDKRESELAVYSADELRELIGPNRSHVQVYDASQGQSVAARYKAERVGTPLWQYCLWAALICLLAEVLLLRFVNQAKPVPAATTVV